MTEDVGSPAEPIVKGMRLRYAGTCVRCGQPLPEKKWAFYDKASKTVFCTECPAPSPSLEIDELVPLRRAAVQEDAAVDQVPDQPVSASDGVLVTDPEGKPDLAHIEGAAGSSARREYEHRSAAREARIRAKHPKAGGLLLALFDDPQSTTAWAIGAQGERRLADALAKVVGPELRVLHDRRIPRTRANIDHLVICPSGVYVVDAKQYKGRPALRVEGGLFRPRVETLTVAGRDRSNLVDGVHRQVDLVREQIGPDWPIHGALCFVAADWPLFGGAFSTQGVAVLWPKKLASMLIGDGPLDEGAIAGLQTRLATAFPAA